VVVIQNTPATADGGSTVSETSWKALLFTSGASAADPVRIGWPRERCPTSCCSGLLRFRRWNGALWWRAQGCWRAPSD
jgi:hypothetical protein